MWITALIISAMALTLSGCPSASVSRDRDECLDIATEQEAEIGRLTLELQAERAGSGYWQSLYRQAVLMKSQAVLMKSQAEGRQALADASAARSRDDASAALSRNRGHAMEDFHRQQEIDKLERRLDEVEAR